MKAVQTKPNRAGATKRLSLRALRAKDEAEAKAAAEAKAKAKAAAEAKAANAW